MKQQARRPMQFAFFFSSLDAVGEGAVAALMKSRSHTTS